MPALAAWRATPRGRRSISEAARALGAYTDGRTRLALLVGAGVDQALAGRPGWTDLLGRLGDELLRHDQHAERLAEVAAEWPMEAAEALRLTLGPQDFITQLRTTLPPVPGAQLVASSLAAPITALVQAGIGVIVSLNYTDDLAATLKLTLPPAKSVRVIERAELSAWPLGDLLNPPADQVHVLKLHGSVPSSGAVSAPSIVLDRSSYDAALSADTPYREILSRLFEDFTVLSVGVSWADVPLRDAAAQARRRLPVARPMHYAARQRSGSGARDWWEERALTASYGLRPLYYAGHHEVAEILTSIVGLADPVSRPAASASLEEIAGWLDRVGDFESQQQSAWFAEHWRTLSDLIKDACEPGTLTPGRWLAAARAERHLRHFIWFWLDPKERAAHRNGLWEKIARALDDLPPSETSALWQDEQIAAALEWDAQPSGDMRDRVLLEFALGAYEIYGRDVQSKRSAAPWIGKLDRVRQCARSSSIAAYRISLASQVWATTARSGLLEAARNACWESMEAKIALDIAQDKLLQTARSSAPTPRDWPGALRDPLWRECDHVRELSRVTGCNRREAGAVVLASLLAPADHAESDLIAAYRRVRDLSGGKPEPTAAWSVVIGLIAVFVDQVQETPREALIDPLSEWLIDRCGEIPIDAALACVVEKNFARHWSGFHDQAGALAPLIATRLLQKKH